MKKREYKGRSLIDFPSEYVCIDVETTGLDFDTCEIIEIAAFHIKGGNPLERFVSLVKPTEFMEYQSDTDTYHAKYINEFISELTGITNEMLEAAPEPKVVFPQFWNFVGRHILVGHNVNFDINFIYDACITCGLKLCNDFVDTLRIARKALPDLKHHRLSDIVSYFSITQDSMHRAESDAYATALCFEALKLYVESQTSIEKFKEGFVAKKWYDKYKIDLNGIIPTVSIIDETNPFFGKVVVFTGDLSSMTRREAFQLIVNLGGIPENSITKRTNFLIVGSMNGTQLKPTTKIKKAQEYMLKGQDIVFFSECTFLQMIGSDETDRLLEQPTK